VRVAIGSDHAGYDLKEVVGPILREAGHEVVDVGTNSGTDSVDYPVYASRAAHLVAGGEADRAVIVCGSGAGVAIAACKFPGIRAFVGHDTYTAHQAVEHDNGNVLCMGGRVIGPLIAAEVLAAFSRATFSGEERHVRRLGKIDAIEREFAPGGS